MEKCFGQGMAKQASLPCKDLFAHCSTCHLVDVQIPAECSGLALQPVRHRPLASVIPLEAM